MTSLDDRSTEHLPDAILDALDVPVFVWQLGEDGEYDSMQLVHATPATIEVSLRPAEDLIGRRMRDIFPSSPPSHRQALYTRVARGEPARDLGDVAFDFPDGRRRTFNLRVFPLPGRRVGVRAVDVTARRAAEADLLRTLDGMSDGFFAYDQDWRFTYLNQRAEWLAMCPREELVGQVMWEKYPMLEGTPVQEAYLRCVAEQTATQVEYYHSGRGLWLRLSISPTPYGAASFVQDITAERTLEEHLDRRQRADAVAAVAGGVAHDFNNALMAIRTAATLAEGAGSIEEMRDDLREIDRVAEHAAGLTAQILRLGQSEPVEPSGACHVIEVLSEFAGVMRSLLGDAVTVAFESTASDDLVPVNADGMRQILLNLSLNAAAAMPSGGRLTLATAATWVDGGPAIGIMCHDTGVGMDEWTQEQAFEPFFTTKPEGTGLGLSSVRRVVEAAGGEVLLASAPGEGTTVTIRLPVLTAEPEDAGAADAAAEADVTRPRVTVLLVEDDDHVRPLVARVIERSGLRVLTARTPADALDLFEQEPADVLLTDVSMPGMSGPALASQLQERRTGLRVVLMSGYGQDRLRQHGVTDEHVVLHKPFTSRELVAALDRVLPTPR